MGHLAAPWAHGPRDPKAYIYCIQHQRGTACPGRSSTKVAESSAHAPSAGPRGEGGHEDGVWVGRARVCGIYL
jgi:hypothetical protein